MQFARTLIAVGVLTLGCAPAPAAEAPVPVTQIVFDPVTEVDLTQMTRHARGFYWRDVVVGQGRQAQSGLDVRIDYIVRMPNGTVVDRADPARPLQFKLGERHAIVALELALRSMKEGGMRQLVVPPELAYGVRGNGNVPANATLVMIIHLVKVG